MDRMSRHMQLANRRDDSFGGDVAEVVLCPSSFHFVVKVVIGDLRGPAVLDVESTVVGEHFR